MLDTDQLRSFLAIVDSGSFTKAAERVHKTQSAVSMHIRRLEEQLGCALFVKQGRGARLTDEGERLIEFARRIVQVEAGAMAALSRKGLRGAVRLGIPDDYAEAFLADILSRFNRRHPLVEVSVVCEASTELAPQVAAGALDLALITGVSSRGSIGPRVAARGAAWCGSPPSDFRPRKERRSRSRSAAPTCSGGVRPRRRWPRRPRVTEERFYSKNFTAIGSIVARGAGGDDPARFDGRSGPARCWGAPKACRNCP